MPRKKRSPTTPGSEEAPGAAAAVVRKIVELHGGKRTVAQKLGNSISRPLLVAICKGERPTTATTVAELCRVCPADLAAELVAAHLQDELRRIQGRYTPKGSVLAGGTAWSGEPNVSIDAASRTSEDTPPASVLAAAKRLIQPFANHRDIVRKVRARRKAMKPKG